MKPFLEQLEDRIVPAYNYVQEIKFHLETLQRKPPQFNFYQNYRIRPEKVNIIKINEFPPQKLSPIPSIKRTTLMEHLTTKDYLFSNEFFPNSLTQPNSRSGFIPS